MVRCPARVRNAHQSGRRPAILNLWVHALGNPVGNPSPITDNMLGLGVRRDDVLRGWGHRCHRLICPTGSIARMDRPFGTKVLVQKPLRAKTNFPSVFNVIWLVQRARKIFRFTILKIRNTSIAIPPHSEGRFANVTDAGRAAMDAAARLTGVACSGRRRRVVLTPRRWCQVGGLIRVTTVARKPITGESTV